MNSLAILTTKEKAHTDNGMDFEKQNSIRQQTSPHCQNSCHPHLNNPNGEKGDNHGTIQCRTQTGYTKQTFIT